MNVGDTCAKPTSAPPGWSGYTPSPESRKYVGEYTTNDGMFYVTVAPVLNATGTPSGLSLPEVGKEYTMEDYFVMIGKAKLDAVGWSKELHDLAHSANDAYPACQAGIAAFSYTQLAFASGMFADFLNDSDINNNKMELAAFMANSATETMGGSASDAQSKKGFCYNFEVSQDGNAYGNQSNNPCNEEAHPTDTSKDNWGYYGRGGFQLTHCYNYRGFTSFVENYLQIPMSEETNFYKNPKLIATDYAFVSAIWFWMSAESEGTKPSMHYIVNGWKKNGSLIFDNHNRGNDFGYLANILNGGYECSGRAGPGKEEAAANRLSAFKDFSQWMKVNTADYSAFLSINSGCNYGVTPDMGDHPFQYFMIDGEKDLADVALICDDWVICDSNCVNGLVC